jgi:hypothetical protein
MPKRPWLRKDASGRNLNAGDIVRVIGVPNLEGMSESGLLESLPVFRHLVGTYRRIERFDRHGFAELSFRVRRGPLAGLHSVAIEPFLLRRKNAARGRRT